MRLAVLAFGHLHFKACCKAEGVDWREATHVTNLGVFNHISPQTTRLVVHTTGHDHRKRDLLTEAKRLGYF